MSKRKTVVGAPAGKENVLPTKRARKALGPVWAQQQNLSELSSVAVETPVRIIVQIRKLFSDSPSNFEKNDTQLDIFISNRFPNRACYKIFIPKNFRNNYSDDELLIIILYSLIEL